MEYLIVRVWESIVTGVFASCFYVLGLGHGVG